MDQGKNPEKSGHGPDSSKNSQPRTDAKDRLEKEKKNEKDNWLARLVSQRRAQSHLRKKKKSRNPEVYSNE